MGHTLEGRHGEIQHREIFVYFVDAKGTIVPAPDSRVSPEQVGMHGWRRCEAVGAKEIERVSLILSRQMEEKKRKMRVQQHLREQQYRDQLKIRCRLRLAQGYSEKDVEMNRRLLKRTEAAEDRFMKMIAKGFDPTNRSSMLEMERKEDSQARGIKKPTGIQT